MKRNTTLQPQPCMLHMEHKAKCSFPYSTHIIKAIECVVGSLDIVI